MTPMIGFSELMVTKKFKVMEGCGESFVIVVKYIDTLNIQKLV